MFIKKYGNRIRIIAAKVIDDLLVAGDTADIQKFIADLSAEFQVGNTEIGGAFRLNGCEIDSGPTMIELYMCGYL